jgi:hypothetical protein
LPGACEINHALTLGVQHEFNALSPGERARVAENDTFMIAAITAPGENEGVGIFANKKINMGEIHRLL